MDLTFDYKSSLVLVTGLLTFILSSFVLFKKKNDAVNSAFGIMAFLVGVWSIAAFLFRELPLESSLMHGYILYIAASLLPPSFLLMTLVFPPKQYWSKKILYFLLFETLIVVIVTSVPNLVITGLEVVNNERILIWGQGYSIYALHQVGLFLIGYIVLFKKFLVSKGEVKTQIKYIIVGTIVPANLALTTNLILPWLGQYEYYTWVGQICMIVLVGLSGYAIVKHHLFGIKTIATELLVVATSMTLLVRVFLTENSTDKIIGLALFVSVALFGWLLARSVWREVEQREQLQNLSNRLADANQQLTVLDKARAEFISIASHQLRTPPATIKWFLAAILSGDYGKMSPKIKVALEKAQVTNNSLIGLIDDMLNASRIERGKMEFLFEPADVVKLTDEIVMELTPQAEMKKLKLIYKKSKVKFPQILADKEKLQQVVNNLIDNAIKYTKKGSVTVELSKTRTDIVITVKDTGKGMSTEEKNSLFQKYSRSSTSQKHSSGLGLGLYVAKVIAEHHKGRVTATSEGVDKGTTFVVTLPIKTDLKAETFDLTQNQGTNTHK